MRFSPKNQTKTTTKTPKTHQKNPEKNPTLPPQKKGQHPGPGRCPAAHPPPPPAGSGRVGSGRAVLPPAHSPAAGRGASGSRLPGRRGRLPAGLRPPPHPAARAAASPARRSRPRPPTPRPHDVIPRSRPARRARGRGPDSRLCPRGGGGQRCVGRGGGRSRGNTAVGNTGAALWSGRFTPGDSLPALTRVPLIPVKEPWKSLCWKWRNAARSPRARTGGFLSLGVKKKTGAAACVVPLPSGSCAAMASPSH